MLKAYRLSSGRYPANSGAGAALRGGRWNPPGIPAIYCAENRSLAALEILVLYDVLPRDFAITPIDFASDLVSDVVPLPPGWETSLNLTRSIGASWHDSLRSAVLRVPSSVEPNEWNFVINPDHQDFARILFGTSEPYRFDPRLKP